ncbi:MAG: helix-turn-helix domain-containing protein [Pseudomonadota bacterium]
MIIADRDQSDEDTLSALATPAAPAVASAGLIRPLIDMAEMRGVSVEDILNGLGLPPDLFAADSTPVALADYYRLQNQISAALEDETCNLSTRQLLPGTTDFVLSQISGVGSLHDAMNIVAKSYNLVHGGEYNSVRRRGDVVTFTIDDRGFPYAIREDSAYIEFSLECLLIFLHCMLTVVAPETAGRALRKVAVTRSQRTARAAHLACWPAPIAFGARAYAIDYDADAATAPLAPPPADALTAAHVHAQILKMAGSDAGAGALKETSEFVRRALARGVIDQTRIAAMLGVSVATLRRRLDEEGASFRDLRREVLNAAAKRLLARRRNATEVAEELGFAELRSFSRAFKSWNGETPKAFAQRALSSAGSPPEG